MNSELLEFIETHKLDVEDFFDANGKSTQSCYAQMKVEDKLFAYNTTPCGAYGHTVRDRNGHCVFCNTASVAFSLRKKQIAHIYIACSVKKEITKVGMSTEQIDKRLSKLNSRRVGNTDDWVIVSSVKCAKANVVELALHYKLEKYRVRGDLYGETESKEIFRCSYQKANELLKEVLKSNKTKLIEQKTYVLAKDRFKFRNLISL
jgi:hypothetical protein